jgi:hypothetical protein
MQPPSPPARRRSRCSAPASTFRIRGRTPPSTSGSSPPAPWLPNFRPGRRWRRGSSAAKPRRRRARRRGRGGRGARAERGTHHRRDGRRPGTYRRGGPRLGRGADGRGNQPPPPRRRPRARGPRDIAGLLGLPGRPATPDPLVTEPLALGDDERLVWRALAEPAPDLDVLVHRTGLAPGRCAAAVTALELRDHVGTDPPASCGARERRRVARATNRPRSGRVVPSCPPATSTSTSRSAPAAARTAISRSRCARTCRSTSTWTRSSASSPSG